MQLFYFVYGAFALIFLKLAQTFITHYQRSQRAKALGCAPPPSWPENFLGLSSLRAILAADKEWRLLPWVMARHYEMSDTIGRPAATFSFRLLGAEIINTTDPENIKAILATQFQDFELGPIRNGNFRPFLGEGIFTQDGKAWEHSRAMLRPNFVRDQVADLELEEEHIQNLMRVMPINNTGWTEDVNLQTLFFRLTLDSATQFLFGHSVNSQLADLPNSGLKESKGPDEKLFAYAFDDGQRHLARRGRFRERYWLHNPKGFREDSKHVAEFVDHFVDLALQAPTSSGPEKAAGEEQKSSRYIFSHSLAQQTRNPREMRAQLLNILLAGRDTTASLLSFVFRHLVRDPAAYATLRSAVLRDFGTYTNPNTKNLTFSGLKNCAYLQQCLNETLRLTTVVPVNQRQANKDTTIPRGGGPDGTKPIFIKKGQCVDYSISVLHRRKDIWGPDAEEFKPERWAKKNAGRLTSGAQAGWEYLPFNGGPRICIGQQFALTESAYVVVRLVQRFEEIAMGTGEDDKEWAGKTNVTLTAAPGRGPIVRMKEARE